MSNTEWYVVVQRGGYPLSIYVSKECAKLAARKIGGKVVLVAPQASQTTDHRTYLRVQATELRHLLEISKGNPILEPQLRDRLREAQAALEAEK